ncbi:hypothetical protein FQN54_006291 [Arachnomyces sp. PD_36]|nr:hypothetical protein FQN54_006291 [Arachnomyces sp. PD_36]
MVPRAFLFSSAPSTKQQSSSSDEDDLPTPSPKAPRSRSRSRPRRRVEDTPLAKRPTKPISDIHSVPHTDPVLIPSSRASRTASLNSTPSRSIKKKPSNTTRPSLKNAANSRTGVPTSVANILQVTSIPRPPKRAPRGNAKRLPTGNNVEDFSKLLLEGVETGDLDGLVTDSPGSSSLGILLSPPDEDDDDKLTFESDHSPESGLSVRCSSSDSLPSLMNDTGSFTPSNDIPTPPRGSQKWLSEKKHPLVCPPEECTSDHPLLPMDSSTAEEEEDTDLPMLEPCEQDSTDRVRSLPKLGLSFKSNLTASLRALKSAAQTVSNFTNPSVQSEDFLTRSFFSFSPELTDDRRPTPTNLPPSPALRRYLNPIPTSPAEIHVYQEYPTDPFNKVQSCPASIQMQTYRRSSNDRSNKKGSSVSTAGDEPLPLPRQREPRENSNFLRMVVLEMNMRRRGKLRDDIPTRVKVYLPPRQGGSVRTSMLSNSSNTCRTENNKAIPQRWVGVSAVECS